MACLIFLHHAGRSGALAHVRLEAVVVDNSCQPTPSGKQVAFLPQLHIACIYSEKMCGLQESCESEHNSGRRMYCFAARVYVLSFIIVFLLTLFVCNVGSRVESSVSCRGCLD